MRCTVSLALVLLTASFPAMAKTHHGYHHTAHKAHHAEPSVAHDSHPGITCGMVRAYVAQVGLNQAIAMAKSAGISASDEERARRCLAKAI